MKSVAIELLFLNQLEHLLSEMEMWKSNVVAFEIMKKCDICFDIDLWFMNGKMGQWLGLCELHCCGLASATYHRQITQKSI
jgi:hypothetical protein